MNAESSPTPTNLAAELRDLVNRSFDTNEMHELAFDFSLDFDDIPGRGKPGKIVELLQMLARQQRIPEFIERCQVLRPREDWAPLLEAARREPISFAVDVVEPETAVSQPTSPTAPSLLQNRNLLIGLGALVLVAIVVAVVLLNGRGGSDFANDSALVAKIEAMTSNPKSERQLFFDEGTPGWLLTSNSAVFLPDEEELQLGANSVAVRDRTFGPGQAILIDFFLDEVSSTNPVVTFSLQNAQNRADATRVITLQALAQPDSSAIENGAEITANQFTRNTTLVAGQSYTVIMGLDGNGRFLATLFGFGDSSTADDAIFTYTLPGWPQDTWWFTIDTGSQGRVTLLGGWDFTFDTVK